MTMESESNLNSKNVEVERQRSSLYFVTRGVLGDRYALLGTFMLLVFVICGLPKIRCRGNLCFSSFVSVFYINKIVLVFSGFF